jgi:predicted  nucleic acid-binding Zn-ribbon protein
MNELNKNLSELLDVTPIPEEKKEKLSVVSVSYNKPDIESDLTDAYQQSKENLQGIIDQGHEAMEEILNIAKAGQHPRAFEVYGTLLKNMVDANKELLNIQKQMREMDKKKEVNNTTIDKAIFVGSTAALGKLLKDNGKQ